LVAGGRRVGLAQRMRRTDAQQRTCSPDMSPCRAGEAAAWESRTARRERYQAIPHRPLQGPAAPLAQPAGARPPGVRGGTRLGGAGRRLPDGAPRYISKRDIQGLRVRASGRQSMEGITTGERMHPDAETMDGLDGGRARGACRTRVRGFQVAFHS
jgi:hypothetical protein